MINVVSAEKRLELKVEGYGLLDVMGTTGVEGLQSKTNHILEMQAALGIEAARLTIIREIMETMQKHG